MGRGAYDRCPRGRLPDPDVMLPLNQLRAGDLFAAQGRIANKLFIWLVQLQPSLARHLPHNWQPIANSTTLA